MKLSSWASVFGGVAMGMLPLFAQHRQGEAVPPGGTAIYHEDFESDKTGFTNLNVGWRIEPGVGVDGSRALVWRKPAVKGSALAKRTLAEFRPGMELEVSFKVKVLDWGTKRIPAGICDIEWWNLAGEWSGGCGAAQDAKFEDFPVDEAGWSRHRFTVPYHTTDCSRSVIEFFPLSSFDGVLAVDELIVRMTERRALTRAMTSAYRGKSREGRVSFSAGYGFDTAETPYDSVRCRFAFRTPTGETRTVDADETNRVWGRVALDTAEFAVGPQNVRVTLETKDGKVLDTRLVAFERLAPETPMPRVYLDGSGRAIVNGKRFFPLGMFWHDKHFEKKPDALARYAAGPFNCLQTYEYNVTKQMLDAFWAKGLHVIPSLMGGTYLLDSFREPTKYGRRPEIWNENDARAFIEREVMRIKDHPAILAWYTCDEMFPWMAPLYFSRAALVRRLDPDHPHYAVGNMVPYVPALQRGFDVYGPDLYFIRTTDQSGDLLKPDRGSVWKCPEHTEKMIDACGGTLPLWPVPQAFARAWDYRRSHPEYLKKFHFPTALEFRALCWQYIAIGANGLVHYAYGQMLDCIDDKAEFETAWKAVCDASADVRAQIPVLLKDEGPRPRDVPKNVRIRTWRDADAVYALVCNLRPDPLAGEAKIDAKGASVERLSGEGTARFENGTFAFDLGPFAHALVRIR